MYMAAVSVEEGKTNDVVPNAISTPYVTNVQIITYYYKLTTRQMLSERWYELL